MPPKSYGYNEVGEKEKVYIGRDFFGDAIYEGDSVYHLNGDAVLSPKIIDYVKDVYDVEEIIMEWVESEFGAPCLAL